MNLLASSAWILDIVFIILVIGGMAYGVYRGFIKCVCKLAGTFFSVIFAISFCVAFANFLENLFGMTSAIARGLESAFSKKELYSIPIGAEINGAELSAALKEIGIGGFTRFLLNFAFKNVENIPANATTAMMLGSILAKWISIAISFVLLVLIMKFGSLLIGSLLTAVADSLKPVRVINQLLGGIVTMVEALILIFFLLAICRWLPFDGLHSYISSSGIVGGIFNSEWFANAINYAISGKWFTDYLAGYIM